MRTAFTKPVAAMLRWATMSAKRFRPIALGACFLVLMSVVVWERGYLREEASLRIALTHYIRRDVRFDPPPSPSKKILMWTPLCSNKCSIFDMRGYRTKPMTKICGGACEVFWDRNMIDQADGVVIARRFMVAGRLGGNGHVYPQVRRADQVFIDFELEPPLSPLMPAAAAVTPKNFFNATMSYMFDSDIHFPYGVVKERNMTLTNQDYANLVEPILKRKTHGIFKVFSNCRTGSRREDLIGELKKHVSIDLYGRCANKACDDNCYKKNIERYRFYLAFENSVCDDYITEKYFQFQGKLVPIVLRSADYQNFPDRSYIAADQFSSVKELGEHLNYLMKNETAYGEYFEYLRDYKVVLKEFSEMGCKVCDYLRDGRDTKTYEDTAKWFDPNSRCDLDFVPRLMKQPLGDD